MEKNEDLREAMWEINLGKWYGFDCQEWRHSHPSKMVSVATFLAPIPWTYLNLVFQVGLLIVIIAITVTTLASTLLSMGQPYITSWHVLSYLTLTSVLWNSHDFYFSPSQSIESICQSHAITKNGRGWKNIAHWGDSSESSRSMWVAWWVTGSSSQAEDIVTWRLRLGDDWDHLNLTTQILHINHGDLPAILNKPTPLKNTPLDITTIDFFSKWIWKRIVWWAATLEKLPAQLADSLQAWAQSNCPSLFTAILNKEELGIDFNLPLPPENLEKFSWKRKLVHLSQ